MEAMVLQEFGKALILKDMPEPRIGSHEVLVEVKACGVCATDLKIAKGKIPSSVLPNLPHILGHEIAGKVIKTGTYVNNVREGDRVAVYFYVSCGNCNFCRTGYEPLCDNLRGMIGFRLWGGYARYVKVPSQNLAKIPLGVSYEEAAIISDAVATPVEAVRNKVGPKPGHIIVIMGIGGLGIHAVQICKLYSATVIAVDISLEKLEMSKQFGADKFMNPRNDDLVQETLAFTKGQKADTVIDFVGTSETIKLLLSVLKKRGKFILVGYTPNIDLKTHTADLVLKEINIMGSRASSRQTFFETVNLVGEKRIRPVITDEFPLSEANSALKTLAAGKIIGRAVLKI